MRIVSDVGTLDARGSYWVAAVTAPARDWPGAPGCRRGARFLIDPVGMGVGHGRFAAFDDRAECLRWIMANRADIAAHAPAARIAAVQLDRWMLGVDAL